MAREEDQPYSVLVVDDATDVRVLLGLTLNRSGSFTVVADGGSGREAIDLAARHQPDVVLLDVSMPGMDGLEALPRVRDAAPMSTIVMLSGFASRGIAAAAVGMGADGFLSKDVSLDEIPSRLAAIVAERGLADVVVPPGVAVPSPPSDREAAAARAVLGEQLERSRALFDLAPAALAALTPGGRIARANAAFCALVCRREDELSGRQLHELAADDDRDALASVVRGVASGTRPADSREVRLAGDVRWLRFDVQAIREGDGGQPSLLAVTAVDVSALHDLRDRLAATEQQRDAVAGLVGGVVVAVDPSGACRDAAPPDGQLAGRRARDLVGTSILELARGDDVLRLRAALETAAATGRGADLTVAVHGGGELHVTVEPLRPPGGRAVEQLLLHLRGS